MKLASLLVFIALASAAPAYSIENRLSLGAGLNFNMPVTDGDLDSGTDEEVSANVALAGKAEFKIDEFWAFRTGLWLQEKSAKYSFDYLGLEGDVSFTTLYLSVPLTAQYQVQKDIALFGGYIADFRINDYCREGENVDSCSTEENSKSVVHVATLGISVIARENFVFDFSYQHGLSDVYTDIIKINTFQGMAYYRF